MGAPDRGGLDPAGSTPCGSGHDCEGRGILQIGDLEMANVLLTESCVRACPYCFAKQYMAGAASREISWENLIYVLDFLDRSKNDRVTYLGGEPTLHPEFSRFVLYTLDRGFRITVFTSGVVSEATLASMTNCLMGVPAEKLHFICNLNQPSLSPDAELASIHRFLNTFGRRTGPGYTLYQVDFDLKFLVDYVARFSLSKDLRLGLAHPIPGQGNACISAAELSVVARRLANCIPLFEVAGIRPHFDCGMPHCLFDDAELSAFCRLTGCPPRFTCDPPIDIGPDLSVWPCFPLHGCDSKSLHDFNNLSDVVEFFKQTQERLRSDRGGVLPACRACVLRDGGTCGGGCVAHLVQRQ